eukprot:UN07225
MVHRWLGFQSKLIICVSTTAKDTIISFNTYQGFASLLAKTREGKLTTNGISYKFRRVASISVCPI